jgi:murein DD-endopeptidase MepM/ murein hydrolase activator NlpD
VAKVPPSSKYDTGLVTVRRSTIVAALLAATVLTGWSAGATWLILSKDHFGAHLLKRETARQYVYEDRIASLKTEIDKLSNRQLLNQDGVDARVAELITRQTQLETRQAVVSALADSLSGSPALAGARSARPAAAAPAQASASPAATAAPATTSSISSFAPATRPTPVPDIPGLRREPERRGQTAQGWEQSQLPDEPSLQEALIQIDRRLSTVAASQLRALGHMETSVTKAHASLRSIVTDVGLDPDRLAMSGRQGGQGGPFIPAQIDPRAGPFEASVTRLQPRISAMERMRAVVTALPLRRPMGPEGEQSSPFGHRLDPFTRSPAMHSGIDFRAEQGSPVRAGGPGRVVAAEYSGGYGNMVEIDHGGGITTRYAHLSQMSVQEGQQVGAGQIIGRVGSTGRSTGPHLHYETRIDGDAVDPQRFLRVGQRVIGPH